MTTRQKINRTFGAIADILFVAILVAVAVLILCLPRRAQGAETDRSAIGMNVGFIGSYVPMFPFNDRMKSAEPWKNGECQVWGIQPGTKGDYTLIYPGSQPTIIRGGTLTTMSPGRWKLTASGGELKIRVADTSKLVQILPVGVGESRGAQLSDDFKESKKDFDFIRLLDVVNANWTQGPLTAANRPKVTDQFWNTTEARTCPLEPFIDFAAESSKVLYVNVPHTATLDWVEWLCNTCAAKGVRLILTFSNETWNNKTFAGGSMWPQKGVSVPDGGVPKLARAAGLSTEAYTLMRCVGLGRIARRIMPAGSVEVAWEIQIAGGIDTARRAWNVVKPAPGEVQFVAGAPYMSDSTASTDPKVHAANYLAKATRWLNGVGDTMAGMPKLVQLCKDTGTEPICYEANNEPALKLSDKIPAGAAMSPLDAQLKAQSLPETGQAVGTYIDALFKFGFKRVMIYADFGVDVWALERDHRPPFDSPASLAVRDRAAKYRIPKVGGTIPPPVIDPPPVVTPPGTVPAPAGLTIADEGTQLRLRWGPVAGATYKMYRDGVLFDTSNNEDGTSPKTPGVYHVTAVIGGKESDKSNLAPFNLPDPNAGKRARIAEIDRLLGEMAVEQASLQTERTQLIQEIGN